ncbi:MAG: O-antigen ligase family protein [Candidatus Pacebacteria bacterium]|nr:O-antigen ligase family protein [Candidatus Paceibacterota bacterium]
MVLNTALKYFVYGGLFILTLLPLLVISDLLFPFIAGKGFFFRIVVELILAAWILLALRDQQYRPRRSPLVWAGAIFIIILILATIFGVDPLKSFWSNFERMEGLSLYLHLAAYFTVLISMFKSEKWWRYFFFTTLGVSIVVSLHAIRQLLGLTDIHQGGARIDANFGNASYLAVYLLFHLFLSAWLWASSKVKNYYGLVALALLWLVQLVLLYHTATRGAIIGFILGIMVTALIIGFKKGGRARALALAVPVIILIGAGTFYLIRNTELVQKSPVLERFANMSLSEGTVQSRFLIWRLSLSGVGENPILGWGPENYNIVFNKYYDARLWPQEQWFDRSHNIYLDWLIHAGLLGLISYLSILALAFWSLIKIIKNNPSQLLAGSLGVGLLVSYMVHNFFVFDNLVSYFLFLSVIGYIHYLTLAEAPPLAPRWEVGMRGSVVASIIILIGLVVTFNLINVRPIKTGMAIIDALSPLPAEITPEQSLNIRGNLFMKAVTGSYLGRAEAREQLMQMAAGVAADPNVKEEQKMALLQFTASQLDAQTKDTPQDARPYLFLGNFLLSFSNYQEALVYLQRALELSPQKHAVLFALGWAELKSGQVEQGLARLKATAEMSPDYPAAVETYRLGLKEVGRAR